MNFNNNEFMNIYEVKLFYQVQLYSGWSCEHPKAEYIARSFMVESFRTKEELENILRRTRSHTFLQIVVTNCSSPCTDRISEDQLIDYIKHAKLTVDYDASTKSTVESTNHNFFDADIAESEQLYESAKFLNQISFCSSYDDVSVVRLVGYMSPAVFCKGKCIVPFGRYSWIDSYNEGYARVIRNNKWGIINIYGKEVVLTENNDIRDLKDDYFECRKDGRHYRVYLSSLNSSVTND